MLVNFTFFKFRFFPSIRENKELTRELVRLFHKAMVNQRVKLSFIPVITDHYPCIPNPQYGQSSFTERSVGSRATFSCNGGFEQNRETSATFEWDLTSATFDWE